MIEKIRLLFFLSVFQMAWSLHCTAQNSAIYASVSHTNPSLHFGSIQSYPDSIVYLFNTDRILKADAESIRPMLFKIKLPTGLLSTYTAGFDSFGFRYPEKQCVYVYLDRFSNNTTDTSYQITDGTTIDRLLLDKLDLINHPNQMDVDNNSFNPDRSTWLIQRGKASILLYNINKQELSRFLSYTTSFTFL